MFAWCRYRVLTGIVVLSVASVWQIGVSSAATCERCGWMPPATRNSQTVGNTAELERAVRNAHPHTAILLEDGVYRLNRMLDIRVPNVVLRGKSGDRAKVILRGQGMTERKVGVALSISASNVTICDLTVGHVRHHGIQIRGELGVARAVVHNVRVLDTGQQLLKGSHGKTSKFSRDGLVACSRFEYSNHAPSNYTNGVDVLGGRGWTVRDNDLLRIRGPASQGWGAGPAILFWRNSQNTVVERNLLVDCYRGIALGLTPRDPRDGYFDHEGGVIRNNVLCNLNSWADEGVEANAARDVRIEHNTVFVTGKLHWSIGVRFPMCTAVVRNNLTNRRIVLRNGGQAKQEGNVREAVRQWFVDVERGDLRLAGGHLKAIDAGVPIPDLRTDFDRRPRALGAGPDAGAFEYHR